MKALSIRLVRDEEGQDLIEYGLLAAFISLSAFLVMQTVGTSINDLFGTIQTKVEALAK